MSRLGSDGNNLSTLSLDGRNVDDLHIIEGERLLESRIDPLEEIERRSGASHRVRRVVGQPVVRVEHGRGRTDEHLIAEVRKLVSQ